MYYFHISDISLFPQTHSITSVLHASLSGQAGGSCFGASRIFQKHQLVGAANTNDQITLPQLGSHCRQKRNIWFHNCLWSKNI